MKKISVVVPCYGDEKTIYLMYERVSNVFREKLNQYDYELIFVDDYSPDSTWTEIEKLCSINNKVKGIRNIRNFGFIRNVFFTLLQGSGDVTFMLFGDLQDPPELLPEFVEQWESGHKVVIGQKTSSEESKVLYFIRTVFYKVMDLLSSDEQIEHFNGFGLYDRSFIEVLKKIEDPAPYIKGIIQEFVRDPYIIKYNQSDSLRGKSSFNFFKYYDVAMLGITSYTKALMRIATFLGGIVSVLSLLFGIFVFVDKLLRWNIYPVGVATTIIGIFFIGAVQLFFIGILGEYILSINTRVMKRPLVVVEKKINFDE